MENSRSIAAHVLTLVIANGKSLDRVLTKALETCGDPRDKAFVQELVYGVLRRFWTLKPQLQHLLRRRLRDRDRSIEMLLLVGLYQIQYLSTPAHAAVAATVDACASYKKPWAKGLVNGTLRNAIRQADKLVAITRESVSAESAHSDWFIKQVQDDWPSRWRDILRENNEHPPLTLRVNRLRTSRDDYLDLLTQQGIDAKVTRHSRYGIRILNPMNVSDLPHFDTGYVSVQDEAAQLANELLELPSNGRILDACAAPGGKTAHILEEVDSQLEVVALDVSAQRMGLLENSMQRLGVSVCAQVADAADIGKWWDGSPFDRILVDAPCSGSGVVRRHPDIKVHRRVEDLEGLNAQQSRLLDTLWSVIKPGGKLVYATCSIFSAENDSVIRDFLTKRTNTQVDDIEADWGVATEFGRQVITGAQEMDGFYYARLLKT
jgi:16S rRNA (cytosine967-C5)-methyltransferase